jgi:hypothetical protein
MIFIHEASKFIAVNSHQEYELQLRGPNKSYNSLAVMTSDLYYFSRSFLEMQNQKRRPCYVYMLRKNAG